MAKACGTVGTPAEVARYLGIELEYTRDMMIRDALLLHRGAAAVFDFGEFASPVASRKNDDGTISLVTIEPSVKGLEFVAGELRVRYNDNKDVEWFAVSGGYLQVHEDKVIVLADRAEIASQIDVARAREAKDRIEKRQPSPMRPQWNPPERAATQISRVAP